MCKLFHAQCLLEKRTLNFIISLFKVNFRMDTIHLLLMELMDSLVKNDNSFKNMLDRHERRLSCSNNLGGKPHNAINTNLSKKLKLTFNKHIGLSCYIILYFLFLIIM